MWFHAVFEINISELICYKNTIPLKGIILLPFYQFFLSWFSIFETASHYVVQDGPKLMIFLPLLPECWDYRCALPQSAWDYLIFGVSIIQDMFDVLLCILTPEIMEHWKIFLVFLMFWPLGADLGLSWVIKMNKLCE